MRHPVATDTCIGSAHVATSNAAARQGVTNRASNRADTRLSPQAMAAWAMLNTRLQASMDRPRAESDTQIA